MTEQGPSAKRGAVVTLLGEAVRRHTSEAVAASVSAQLSLWDAGDRLPDDGLPGEIDNGVQGETEGETGKRRGRPPGAQNRATEEFRRFARAAYGDPLLRLFERVFADPVSLGRVLGASSWDVFKAQSEWMIRLLPYMHSAMPAELKVSTKGRLAVAIGAVPGGPAGDRVTDLDPIAALLEFAQQYQGVGADGAAELNGAELNVSAESVDIPKG